MKSFRRLAFLSTIATYVLIFIGGLVRVSGAGLGCPDWPKCFGRWIPPISKADIPGGIDPSTFNITLAWIEYGNRLAGMLTGFLILATAILALVHFKKNRRILYPTLLAALLVAYQGWQGGRVVASNLQSLLVSVHLVLALLIVSLLMYVSQQTYYLEQQGVPEARYPKQASLWVILLWLGGLAQIVLGTQVRTGVEASAAAYPLWSDLQWLGQVGMPYDLHMVLGTLLALCTWFVGILLLKMSDNVSTLVKRTIWGLNILVAVQLMLGFLLLAQGLIPGLQVFHLWSAGLFIGLTLIFYFGVKQHESAVSGYARSVSRLLVPVVTGVVLLAVLAAFVTHSAEESRSDIQVYGEVPEFHFVERSGQPFGLDQFRGKVSVVDFFFANCTGPCPMMSATIAELYREYAYSDKLQFVSLTVDPDRDTLAALNAYAARFGVDDRRWSFIRGSATEISNLCEKGFMVSGELPGMHSTKFILVDGEGRIRGYFDFDDPSHLKKLRDQIRQLVRELP